MPEPPPQDPRHLSAHGLPIRAAAVSRYRLPGGCLSGDGYLALRSLHDARELAAHLDAASRGDDDAVSAGGVWALALIQDILGQKLCEDRDTAQSRLTDIRAAVSAQVGAEALAAVLHAIRQAFLPASPAQVPRESDTDALFRKLLLIWLANTNPAAYPLSVLFDDSELYTEDAYTPVTHALREVLDMGAATAGNDTTAGADLLGPIRAAPHSLRDQLVFVRERWGPFQGDGLTHITRALDILAEEQRPRGTGPGPSDVPHFDTTPSDQPRFSPDRDWMPGVVLIAKNVTVWLWQLSSQYGRPIERLDDIPDTELQVLAERGFTALWLIGIWERSDASRRIKQRCGNPEAAGSAYSLHDYRVADALGGDAACRTLRERAERQGLHLASDMVPNHTGIVSRWVLEHPDWYIALDRPPFPAYRFTGPDLCDNGQAAVRIEDHYYDRTDAAVVFRHDDLQTGQVRYLYHGNDGTGTPWNDTAQLNFLLPTVREAVIQTILQVARRFPIIRFDAAMTLTRQHYQRLWFPEPGTGGAIPTRSEHGMTKDAFDRAMPAEFWREVVERVAAEAPNTLLLAEAFWLLEGYFVRTLGMHRVYNSAFMNMLRDEENGDYRELMRRTMTHDPDILKRFVNFMSNPDEMPAAVQFGKKDKYFGICVLMATLPGLPMFGHGQWEGFEEKYGMEYRRAYRGETPDTDVVQRHDRDITPLLRRRALFADTRAFVLYDFKDATGTIHEDVFAFSNGRDRQRVLVVYHNAYRSVTGHVRDATAGTTTATLAEAMGITDATGDNTCRFHDLLTGQDLELHAGTLRRDGLPLSLAAYACHVFLVDTTA